MQRTKPIEIPSPRKEHKKTSHIDPVDGFPFFHHNPIKSEEMAERERARERLLAHYNKHKTQETESQNDANDKQLKI